MYKIIHNPRCSKSRQTLEILEKHTDQIEIVDYLNGELTSDLLEMIITSLGLNILRTKEDEYKALKIDFSKKDQVIKAILKHPKILERPIVLNGEKAVIGRPPENVLSLLAP